MYCLERGDLAFSGRMWCIILSAALPITVRLTERVAACTVPLEVTAAKLAARLMLALICCSIVLYIKSEDVNPRAWI